MTEKSVPFYRKHVFFCVNQRAQGERCCADFDTMVHRDYLKKKIKATAQHGEGLIRVNQAGCLGRCEQGPVLVVYPEGTWYSYIDQADLDDILEQDLIAGNPVERLMI